VISFVRTLSLPSPSEFYSQFKNNPDEAKRTAFRLGQERGQLLKSRNNIQGDDLEAIAEILNARMEQLMGGRATVEGNRVVMVNTGFCLVMRASMTLGIPWEWLDTNAAWPSLEGIVSNIRPNIRMTIPSARCRGDKACIHVFEIQLEEKQTSGGGEKKCLRKRL